MESGRNSGDIGCMENILREYSPSNRLSELFRGPFVLRVWGVKVVTWDPEFCIKNVLTSPK